MTYKRRRFAATFFGYAAMVCVLIIVGVLILLPIALIAQGFVAAQSSTYWTLAFRRLDLEYAPGPGYQLQPPPAPPAQTAQ